MEIMVKGKRTYSLINDVLYNPDAGVNLLSVSSFLKKGQEVICTWKKLQPQLVKCKMIRCDGCTNYRVLLADGTIHTTNNMVVDERWDCTALTLLRLLNYPPH
ncbi:hypothetical protein GGTG_13457 [Gaeumannomyces tritici R3-111a-1]|uniref:Uncharacterized protein n=1 Tax=Gaeumannomyces tritici (strain R3-111a-1) TaxID=644352 RepID=J3PIX7_GAET3|nr:hypothetical protein GGTG_13457 [Gaeumannomyces tritici R3-111a-1]EJT68951.1 hypothetical protein GGTG_13457 [Gaeumannomyces tritici R3-111a-1]